MDFPEVRKFLLSSYHDLPNLLFIGSLVLGSVLGYLPLIWVALGMILNGAATALAQSLMSALTGLRNVKGLGWLNYSTTKTSSEYANCYVGYQRTAKGTFDFMNMNSAGDVTVVPSHWMSASAFFAAFSIYNSIRLLIREPKEGTDGKLQSNRRAFSISTILMGLFFMTLLGVRLFTGCETLLGASLGIVLGIGVAIAYWHLLDGCGTGKVPDLLQVVGSLAPEKNRAEQPVMCTVD